MARAKENDARGSQVATVNRHESRELWLKAATQELRPYYEGCGYPLPELIRYAIAFTSAGRKGSQPGETWHASDDGHFEIIIKADQFDPVEILGVLMHQLTHAALPADAGHGKLYREAAQKLGLQGQMRHAMPGPLLRKRLEEIVEALGPLPHARLDIERNPLDRGTKPVDRRRKQKTHLLKAECGTLGCGYTVRVTSKWAKLGPPGCPQHGPMSVDLPPDDSGEDVADEGTPAEGPGAALQEAL